MFGRRKGEGSEPEPDAPRDASGEPLRNSALIEAMRNVSVQDTPERRALLYQLLLDSTLVVATPPTGAPHRAWTTQPGDTVSLVMTEDGNGPVLPVFTSVETLAAWSRAPSGYAAVPARALFEMALSSGARTVVLDQGSPTGGFITHREIEALGRGRLPLGTTDVVAEATTVLIGRPVQLPPAPVLDAVRSALAAHGPVDGAWLYAMQQDERTPELVVGVRFGPDRAADAAAVGDGMRLLVEDVGNRSEAARGLLFLHVEPDLAASLAGGLGLDLLRP